MGTPPPIMTANLGMSDTLILMVLALVVFGPRRLPQIGRQIGKLMYEFRKASNDFKFQMDEEFRKAEEADRRKKEEEARQRALAAGEQPAQLESPAPQGSETGTAVGEPGPDPPLKIYPNYPIDDPPEEGVPTDDTASPAVAEAAAAAAEPTAPRTVPRIKPPSTGVTVAAMPLRKRPSRRKPAAAPPNGPGKAPESVNSEAGATELEAERSEPAAHHG